jgi:hypothetical protein
VWWSSNQSRYRCIQAERPWAPRASHAGCAARTRATQVSTFDKAKGDVVEGRLPSGQPTPILPKSATVAAAVERDAD